MQVLRLHGGIYKAFLKQRWEVHTPELTMWFCPDLDFPEDCTSISIPWSARASRSSTVAIMFTEGLHRLYIAAE